MDLFFPYNVVMFFSSQKKPHLVLLLDIQSSVVRGALVYFKPSATPEFIYTHTAPITFKADVSSSHLVQVTLEAVNQTIDVILRELSLRNSSLVPGTLPHTIGAVHYILSSPWIISQAKTLEISFPKEIKLTKHSLQPAITEERNKITGNEADQLSVIEEKVFDIRVSGYSVPNWEGRKAKQVDISFVVSVAGSRVIERLREAVRRVTNTHIEFHSSLLLQTIGIQKVLPHHSSYSLIHVHGELTDVVIIHKHSCIFFGSFPLGVYGLIRKLSKATKTDIHTAQSLLTLYMDGHLDPSHAASTQKIINEVSHLWMSELEKLLVQAGLSTPLPPETIISARSHDDYFMHILKKAKPASRPALLTFEDIQHHIHFARHTERLRILGLCALGIHSSRYE